VIWPMIPLVGWGGTQSARLMHGNVHALS
jgi:hypothetical protein